MSLELENCILLSSPGNKLKKKPDKQHSHIPREGGGWINFFFSQKYIFAKFSNVWKKKEL